MTLNRLIVSIVISTLITKSSIREKQVDRARKKIENSSKLNKLNQNDPRRFISSIRTIHKLEGLQISLYFLMSKSRLLEYN